MKTIGLIGGITWHSSIDYYRFLNEIISEKTNSAATAKIILYSLDFGVVKTLTEADRWNELAAIVCDVAVKLENAGADCIIIGANTMHKIADEIQSAVNISCYPHSRSNGHRNFRAAIKNRGFARHEIYHAALIFINRYWQSKISVPLFRKARKIQSISIT
jgi:hypothetical protein